MRIRDVRQGPDELLYVLVDHENGGVLRIEPSATKQTEKSGRLGAAAALKPVKPAACSRRRRRSRSAPASFAWAQFGRNSLEAHLARSDSYDGRFHYCRAVYRPNPRGDGGSWLTDYPLADIDLSIRLSELTKTRVSFDGGGQPNHLIVQLTSDELLQCPVIIMQEVGRRRGRAVRPRAPPAWPSAAARSGRPSARDRSRRQPAPAEWRARSSRECR